MSRDELFERFGRDNPAAADRMVKVVGDCFAQERVVTQAVALYPRIQRLKMALYGGIVPGVVEIFGPESCGKTALLGSFLATAQMQGKEVALCATEDRDVDYWSRLGVDTDALLLLEAEEAEDMIKLCIDFVKGRNRVLGIDSITALRSMNEEWGNGLEDFKKWASVVWELLYEVNNHIPDDSVLFLTSQVRKRKSGNPALVFAEGTESASRQIVHQFSVRLELSREEVTDDRYTMVINIISNVLGPPAKMIRIPVVKGDGVNHALDLVRVATEVGVVKKNGPWYRMPEKGGVHHGEASAAQVVREDPDLAEALMQRIDIWQRSW